MMRRSLGAPPAGSLGTRTTSSPCSTFALMCSMSALSGSCTYKSLAFLNCKIYALIDVFVMRLYSLHNVLLLAWAGQYIPTADQAASR